MARTLRRTPGRRLDAAARAVVVAVVAGTLLRLVWCLVAVRPHVGAHDPAAYVRLAQDLAAGHGYRAASGAPTAYYPVGYPAALAAAWWLVTHTPLPDDPWWTAAGLNLVAAAVAIALVGVLGRRLVGPVGGAVAAALVAAHPNLVFNTAPALTEPTFVALLLAGLVLAGVGGPAPTPRRAVAAGLCLGAAGLVRPVGLLAALVVVGPPVVRAVRRRGPAAVAGALVAGMLAVTAPWAVRNAVRLDRATLATSTGDNLCIGNHPDATGAFGLPDACFADVPGLVGGAGEARRDRTLTARAARWIVDDPARQVGLVYRRTFWTLRSDHDGLRAVQSYEQDPWIGGRHPRVERWLRTGADTWWWALVALTLVGAGRWLRSPGAGRRTLLAAMAALLLAVWPFFGDTRFHLPLVPLAAVPAADALVALGRRVVGRGGGAAHAGEDHDRNGGERGAVGRVEGEGPPEPGDGPGHDLAEHHVPPDAERERRAGERDGPAHEG